MSGNNVLTLETVLPYTQDMNTTSRRIIEDRTENIRDEQDIKWYLSELDIPEHIFDASYAELVEHFGFAR